jgi:transcriptional regulator GlxA family with amidase domain
MEEPMRSPSVTRHIGILLFPGVEELDAIGPWEVLAYWTRSRPEDGFAVHCLSQTDTVECSKGLTVARHYSLDRGPALDVLIHPGGAGTRRLIDDEAHLRWVRAQRAHTPVMASVCTGALVYAAAGLLRNRPATTHWRTIDHLAELEPTAQVVKDQRFVDDGDVITSAGISAGIDMALHLVGRLSSPDRAREVRKGIQYDPLPPF